MKFNYKNLSKSLLCMLMPALVACGGKSNDTDNVADNLNDPILNERLHRLDSLEVLYSKYEARSDIFHDALVGLYGMGYDMACNKVIFGNEDVSAVEEFQVAMTDSLWHKWYYIENPQVSYEIQDIKDSLPQEMLVRPRTALDSVYTEYNKAVASEQCIREIADVFAREYKSRRMLTKKEKKMLEQYREEKQWTFKRQIDWYQEERENLIKQMHEMQKTK